MNILKKIKEWMEQWAEDFEAMTPEQKAYFWIMFDRYKI
jgi:hypothetical protein